MIEHKNVVGLFKNSRFQFDFKATDVWTLFNSYCFDFTVWKIYGALLHGCALVIIPLEAVYDTESLYGIVKKNKVTVLNMTPQSLYEFIRYEKETHENALCVRYVFYGGESSNVSLLRPFKEKYPSVRFVNLYGPSECTVLTSVKALEWEDFTSSINNIGNGVPMTEIYILDQYLNLLPQGLAGELYVSGNSLGRGYVNNEQLTKERFVPNPFKRSSIMYKTGDLVRRLPTGELEFIGRTDGQIKIRGFRIELGEIEAALLGCEAVKEAVVTPYEISSGDKKLCAYFTAVREISAKELTQLLRQKLPDYMIPSAFLQIDEFPLNRNGKIDRSRLPKLQEMLSPTIGNVPPRDVTEELIANAWANVLDLPTIGIDDNFFELGGDSLSAVRVVSMLKLKINIVDFYLHPTIRQMAEKLSKEHQKAGLLINISKNYNPSNTNVICFPYGGGSALSYREISNAIHQKQAKLNIYAVNLPGQTISERGKTFSSRLKAWRTTWQTKLWHLFPATLSFTVTASAAHRFWRRRRS